MKPEDLQNGAAYHPDDGSMTGGGVLADRIAGDWLAAHGDPTANRARPVPEELLHYHPEAYALGELAATQTTVMAGEVITA